MLRLGAAWALLEHRVEGVAVGGPSVIMMRRETDDVLTPVVLTAGHHSTHESREKEKETFPYESLLQSDDFAEEVAPAPAAPAPASTGTSKDAGEILNALPNPNLGPPEGWKELSVDREEKIVFAQGIGLVLALGVCFGFFSWLVVFLLARKAHQDQESGEANVPMAPDGKLSFTIRLAYCLPTFATLPVTALISVFVLSFYSRRGADLPTMALAVALARCVDVVSDPLMASWTDSCQHAAGRRKPWIIIGAPLYGLCLVALLSPPFLHAVPLAAWFAIMYVGFFLANTVSNIPYDAWAPELSEDSNERTKVFFMSGLFEGLGTLGAFCLPLAGFKISNDMGFTEEVCISPGDVQLRCSQGLTCALYSVNGPGFEWALNTTFNHYYQGRSKEILGFNCEETDPHTFARSASDVGAFYSYCDCVSQCAQACSGGNRSWGFAITGMVFAVWYVFTSFLACFFVKERPPPPEGFRRTPPLIPSMLGALNNPAFRKLLPAWACDAVACAIFLALCPYFVMYVISAEYQTKGNSAWGLDCKSGLLANSSNPHYDRRCNTMVVLGVCVCAALGAAVVATPLWLMLAKMRGKVSAWVIWSFTMAITNFVFVFLDQSMVVACVVACTINGIPLAAKFLADAILADIIDYDEFLTGHRNEAMYTMFKSFLPKVMAIPAAAIPLAVMNMVGHVPAVNGKIMQQPQNVRWLIRVMTGIVSGTAALIAWRLKLRYTLTDDMVKQVTEGIKKHKEGKVAVDPLSGLPYAITKFTEEENLAGGWNLQHFRGVAYIEKIEEDQGAGLSALKSKATIEFVMSFVLTCLCVFGLVSTIPLLKYRKYSIVPTLMAICLGISLIFLIFGWCRFRAARALVASPPSPELVKKVLQNRRARKLLEDARVDKEAAGAAGEEGEKPEGSLLDAAEAAPAAPAEAEGGRGRSRRGPAPREQSQANEEEF